MRKISLATAISMALFSGGANALGLGNIELNSALNQPLDAEIELLSVREGETDGMIVTLASQEAFLRAGIDRPFMLTQLRFEVQQRSDGSNYIRVISNKPVVEPFLNFLIEVDWPRGRLVREYTVLLDPPVFMTEQAESAPAAEAPATEAASAQAEGSVPAPIERVPEPQVEPITAAPESAPIPEPVTQPAPESVAAAPVAVSTEADLFPRIDSTARRAPGLDGTVRAAASPTESSGTIADAPLAETVTVKAGDTLWNIANDVRPAGVSVEKMMLALLRANQNAFIDGNINLVRRGAILRVPANGEIAGLSQAQAIEQVREQNSLWAQYRQSAQPSVAPADASVEQPTAPAPESAPEPAAEVAEAPASEELRIVAEEDVARAVAEANAAKEAEAAARSEVEGARKELALSQEELESVRLERNELQSRVSDLEGTVSKMERLITLRETELAELQARLAEMEQAAAEQAAQQAATPAPAIESPITEEAATETAPPASEAPAEPAATETAQAPVAEERVAESPAAETPQPVAEAPATESAVAEPPRPLPTPTVDQSPLDRLLANPNLLLGGGAAAVLALLLAFLMIRRRLAESESDELSVDLPEEQPVDNVDEAAELEKTVAVDEAFEELVEDAVEDQQASADVADEEATPIELPGEVDADDVLMAEVADEDLPKDDTIAEADVYLAYGLFGQAEDLLKLAVEENPDKLDYRLKLLEAYHSQKNAPAFIAAAGDMQARIDEDSRPLWNRAVAMGRDLAPEETMFQEGDIDEAAVAAHMARLHVGDAGVAPKAEDEVELDQTQIIDTDELGADELGDMLIDGDDSLDKTGTFAPMGSDVDGLEAEFSLDDVDLGIDDDTLAAAEAEIEAATNADGEYDIDDLDDALAFDIEADEPEEISEDTMAMASDLDVTETLVEDSDATMVLDEGDDEATMMLDADDMPTVALSDDELAAEIDDTEFDLERELGLTGADFEETRVLDELDGDEPEIIDESDLASAGELDDIDATLVDESAIAEMLDETMHLDDDMDDLDATAAVESSDDTTGIDTGALEALSIEDGDEVDTMLDLAKAYIDMGDQESAASALNEIISVGNDQQQQEARELLEQIA